MQGVADNIPELQCLDISGNTLSRESVYVLKDVIIRHPKLVYLDVSWCEMDMHSFDSILDACEISGRIQALNVQKTVARSNRGRKSLKRRMKSGKLCLLNVNFHTDDNVERFVNSLRPCFARRLKADLPEVMESILDSSDGVENMYKFLIGNYNEVLDLFNVN
jgi:Ran GTPase-activating protein (RanGAP) involved in mRNA processing and transport